MTGRVCLNSALGGIHAESIVKSFTVILYDSFVVGRILYMKNTIRVQNFLLFLQLSEHSLLL